MAGVRELVERERRARVLGMDGKKPGAGRRLEHRLARRDPRGVCHQEPKAQGRGELLELLAFLRAARVRGQKRGKLLQHGKIAGGRARFAEHAGPVFAQEQDGGGLGGFVGVLPSPGATPSIYRMRPKGIHLHEL